VSKVKRQSNIPIDPIVWLGNLREVDRILAWIDLTKSRNKWLAFVNAVMKLRVPLNAENLLTN